MSLGGGVLADSIVLREPWLSRRYAYEMFEQHRAYRADHGFRLWMILGLEAWYRLVHLRSARRR